jgi:hypothetical protein
MAPACGYRLHGPRRQSNEIVKSGRDARELNMFSYDDPTTTWRKDSIYAEWRNSLQRMLPSG